MNAASDTDGLALVPSKNAPNGVLFIGSVSILLGATGIAKIWTAFAHTKVLAEADPITGVSFGHLMLAVGVLELVIASICLFAKSQTLKLGLIAWLATNFVVYRLGLWWIGWKKPCSCLGNLTDALHISPQLADNIMKVILAYLLIGSYGLLFWQCRSEKRKADTEGKEPTPHPQAL